MLRAWICFAASLCLLALPPGWKAGPSGQFMASNLYGHIDGGAELFLEFGFERLDTRSYQHDQDELSLELYRMTSPEAALGIYLNRCGRETLWAEIPVRHSASHYQITALKGRVFLQLNNPKGEARLKPAMLALLQENLRDIPDEKPKDFFSLLPIDDRIPGSERLIRGPFALQELFTFGEGDVLGLEGRRWAVLADYRQEKAPGYTLMRIRYDAEAEALKSLERLKAHLDPELKILQKSPTGFTFRDGRGAFGWVHRQKSQLELSFGRNKEAQLPAF